MNETRYRNLPSIDRIVSDSRISQLVQKYSRELVLDIARRNLEKERDNIKNGGEAPSIEEIVVAIMGDTEKVFTPGLRPVINASGVVIHTNLGRAPLSEDTIKAMSAASAGYSNLEFDLDRGERGSRHVHIEKLLCQLTGAEAAMAVNNNAGAVLMALTGLAKRKEVIVSRGEAVEIGGGFRIPDVMKESGAKLVEVGTTNRTYIEDYEEAVNEKTAAFMRVHPSNFKVQGFTHGITLAEMIALGKERHIPVIDDLGSGCLLDTTQFGLNPEPTVQQSIASGVALACFSGDKLLGGPQAGIIVGKKQYIDRLKKHPLARALRMDKSRLAGLWATLMHYARGEAYTKIPVWMMISTPLQEIELRVNKWAKALPGKVKVVEGYSMVGGGSLPGETLPTKLLAIVANSEKKSRGVVNLISNKLRENDPPVIARIENDLLLLDPRTVQPDEDDALVEALMGIANLVK